MVSFAMGLFLFLRPAHAPAPFQSGLLLHFTTLTMLVRPANARALHFASLYLPTQVIAFVRDSWSGLASGSSRHEAIVC